MSSSSQKNSLKIKIIFNKNYHWNVNYLPNVLTFIFQITDPHTPTALCVLLYENDSLQGNSLITLSAKVNLGANIQNKPSPPSGDRQVILNTPWWRNRCVQLIWSRIRFASFACFRSIKGSNLFKARIIVDFDRSKTEMGNENNEGLTRQLRAE